MRGPTWLLGIARPAVLSAPVLLGCQDLSHYSTDASRQYVGCVVPAGFVLAGVPASTGICMTLDANHLQDAPGTLSSSDGRFSATPLRPIPQLWSDPLSTLNFGEGRTKNLLYMATPAADGGAEPDVTAVVSLMSGGGVELRLLRGAPPVDAGRSDAAPLSIGGPVFGVFPLSLQDGTCASLLRQRSCSPDAQ